MNSANQTKNLLVAGALAMVVGFSSHAIADEDLQNKINAIKLEVAQLSGVFGGFDRDTGIVTLGGHTSDITSFNNVMEKIKAMPGVKEVRSSVTHD